MVVDLEANKSKTVIEAQVKELSAEKTKPPQQKMYADFFNELTP